MPSPTPEKILQLGFSFWGAKALLSAVELGLFTVLAGGPRTGEELRGQLELHPRSARDFFDALVALGMLNRHGETYSNTAEADLHLDRTKPTYVGGILEMCNVRLYNYWASLTEALKTGLPQNESRHGGDTFAAIYKDPAHLESFLGGMTGISLPSAKAISDKFPWANYKTFADVGTAQGALPVQVALRHQQLEGVGCDLPPVRAIFERYVRSFGLERRVRFQPLDFFVEKFPEVDVIVMGHVLHDWTLEEKKLLIRRAHEALPEGGALIVYEALIDDDRRQNAFGLLMSVNMLIETSGGFDFTGADCSGWMREAGFKETRVEHLIGPDSMVVGLK